MSCFWITGVPSSLISILLAPAATFWPGQSIPLGHLKYRSCAVHTCHTNDWLWCLGSFLPCFQEMPQPDLISSYQIPTSHQASLWKQRFKELQGAPGLGPHFSNSRNTVTPFKGPITNNKFCWCRQLGIDPFMPVPPTLSMKQNSFSN